MRCYLISTVARLVQVVPRDGSHSRQFCQSLQWKASSSIARANETQFNYAILHIITLKYHPYTTSSNRMMSSLYHPYKLKHTQHDFHNLNKWGVLGKPLPQRKPPLGRRVCKCATFRMLSEHYDSCKSFSLRPLIPIVPEVTDHLDSETRTTTSTRFSQY